MSDFLKQVFLLLIFPAFTGVMIFNSYSKFKKTQKELSDISNSKRSKAYLIYVLIAHGFIIAWMAFLLLYYFYALIAS